MTERRLYCISPTWQLHFHSDGTCSAFTPYSGQVVALNELAASYLRTLQPSFTAPQPRELNLELPNALDTSDFVMLRSELVTSGILKPTGAQ